MSGEIKQVGGDHYEADYQHWDWASETGLGYLEGNATKYLARFRKKGGKLDLEKASSYVRKLIHSPMLEGAGNRPLRDPHRLARFTRAAGLTGLPEARLIEEIDRWKTVDDLLCINRRIQELIDVQR